ncbi:MAG: isochorismatase family protein, partial [Pseudomonadota bacterium]
MNHQADTTENEASYSEAYSDDNDLKTGVLHLGKKPALIVVDMTLGFASDESPLGGDFSREIDANVRLCRFFEEKQWPILFTSVVYDSDKQASVFRQRLPDLNILQRGAEWTALHPSLEPFNKRPLIEKHGPSGFFNTSLAAQLASLHVDTLVVTGLTTSGCVRATVIDALQNNFVTLVPIEACGDRNQNAHNANLHDMNAKYASVATLDEIIKALSRI